MQPLGQPELLEDPLGLLAVAQLGGRARGQELGVVQELDRLDLLVGLQGGLDVLARAAADLDRLRRADLTGRPEGPDVELGEERRGQPADGVLRGEGG